MATVVEVVEATISSGKAGLPAAVPTAAAVVVGVAMYVAVETSDEGAGRGALFGDDSGVYWPKAGLYPETYWKPHDNERSIHPNGPRPRPRCYRCD